MRKPIEPASPKSGKGQHDLTPAMPAPQAINGSRSPHSKRGSRSRQVPSSHDGTFSNQTVKAESRISGQLIAANATSRILGIHPQVITIVSSDRLILGFVVTTATCTVVIECLGDASRTQLSGGPGSCASSEYEAYEINQQSAELKEPWPHEVSIDGITPGMRIQMAECAQRKSRLRPEIESVIAGVFRNKYLKGSTNKKNAWYAVREECSLLNIKPPSYSSTAGRLDVLFSQEVLRYY